MESCTNISKYPVGLCKLNRRRIILAVALASIIISYCLFPAKAVNDADVRSGSMHNLTAETAQEGKFFYQWTASDGSPVTSADRIFRWTAPIVKSPREVVITLMVSPPIEGCKEIKELKLQVLPYAAAPGIRIKKDCIFTAPVKVGDSVVYTYNVTNNGGQPLSEMSISDAFNWGTNCQPVYIRGDDGNGLLDPGESWWYECRYVVADPLDYPTLRIMSEGSSSTRTAEIIQRLTDMKARLVIQMDNTRKMFLHFDMKASTLSMNYSLVSGVNFTSYNYTNEVTGESMSKMVDPQGNLNKTNYIDPIFGAVLTTGYDLNGTILIEEIYYPGTKEYLKIQYNLPYPGYRTYTVTDYNTGETLIIVVDSQGNVLSKEYRKTPGYRIYVERFFLRNTATIMAKAPDGSTVSNSDFFTLEIFRPLPLLKITKTADRDPVPRGALLNYTIVYQNQGGEDATGVVVKETYDRNVTFLQADPAPDFGTINTWTVGNLAKGESGTITIRTRVSSSVTPGWRIRNRADMACQENSSDEVEINTTVATIRLNLTKTASAKQANPGDPLDYTISYLNTGDQDAHGVVIKETYDRNFTVLSANPAPDVGTTDTWTVGDLFKGVSGTITIKGNVIGAVKRGTNITNKACVTSRENATICAVVNTPVAGLTITKSASPDIVGKGGTLTYTITYRNDAPFEHKNVIIDDYLDKNVDIQSGSIPPPDDPNRVDNHFTWTKSVVGPGVEEQIVIPIRVREDTIADSIINIYKIRSDNQSATTNATLSTTVVHSIWINKTADKPAYNRDENITYTIRYGNANSRKLDATNIIIEDILPEVDLLSVSPVPSYVNGNILTWRIKKLAANESGVIMLYVHIPKQRNISFDETSSVKGEGFVHVSKRLSTTIEKLALINRANISGYYRDLRSDSSSTSAVIILGSPGTELRTSEHGSGHYEEDEKSSLRLENKSITLQRDLFAKHGKTTFSLPGKRSIEYDSLWSDLSNGKNRVLNDVVSENYLYTDMLSKNSSYVLDMNQTVYKSDAEFSDGLARIAYQKQLPGNAKASVEISEDYHGSFKIKEFVDSYGDSVKYSKSSQGKGFVASDKRPTRNLRSFEHGSGYYNSEETMQLDSVVKNSKMLYAPVNQTADSQKINYSTQWEEAMWTKDPEKGLVISEAIRSASYINKEAEMEKSSLSILGEFNGTMDIQLVQGLLKKEQIRLDQTLVGSFRMDTSLSVFTAPKHLYPHLNISKKAIMQDGETVLFLINVTNDGNKLLKPVTVSDHLPDGLTFINSSIRPEVNGQIINWTIPALDISRTLTIKLRAKVVDGQQWYVNVVSAKAMYKDTALETNNFTRFEAYYQPLPCCPRLPPDGINSTGSFNVTQIMADWSAWKPSPCFNLSTENIDCFANIDEYYNELDRNLSSCCASNYETP
jgi:uncharacterized repeat protein (TIGR01451 family)